MISQGAAGAKEKINMNEYPTLPEGLFLRETAHGLVLTDGNLEIGGDFSKNLRRLRQSNLERELIVRACRIRGAEMPLTVVDATAGLGEDSLLLAAAGFKVRMYEYDPVLAVLLADALRRAADDQALAEAAGRMELCPEDSIPAMRELPFRPDVVLLDPMFPERTKSAQVKKKFQLIHSLEKPCTDERELLDAAKAAGPRRIVIKRPVKGPLLGGVKPDAVYAGKAVRYDVLIFPA